MNFDFPLEINRDRELNFQARTSYWLEISIKFKFWELVDKFMHDVTEFVVFD